MSDTNKAYDPNYLPLQKLLNDFTVAQIKDMALTLGFRFGGKGKKADLIACMAKTLIEEPELIIRNAYGYELKGWLDIIEGRISQREAEEAGFLFELNRFGFVYSFRRKEDNIFFQPDLAERLKPLIPIELERREKDGSLVLEKLAIGLANIYGYTEDAYIQRYFPKLEKVLGKELDEYFLDIALHPILSDTRYGIGTNERPLMSPFAAQIGFDIETDIDLMVDAKEYDIDTILKLGEMPYPIFSGKAADELREVLTKHEQPDCNAESVMRKLWLDHQDKNAKPIPNLDFLRLDDFSQAQPCIIAVMNFTNSVPFWKLRGNSSEEIGRMEMRKLQRSGQKPKISIGPNMRAMGIESREQVEEMARRGESIPDMPPFSGMPFTDPFVRADKKVGRNDPCPCGSGKKYKNCCGR